MSAEEPKPLQTLEREGWVGTINGRKWHYVIGINALCGMRILFGAPELGNDGSSDNCAACKRKLEKARLKAAAKEKALALIASERSKPTP